MNPPEWHDGFKQGVKAKKNPGEDRYRRFARLRRDAPDIADRFLAGEFVRKFKNGTIQPDLVAAEVEAGIRQQGQPARKPDGLAYARKLVSKFSKDDLKALQQHIATLLQQDNANP
jgi:hypothetical protein